MRKIKYIFLAIFTITIVASCINEDNDELTGDGVVEGALISLDKDLISYVVDSDATYEATGTIIQGEVQTTKVEVYNQLYYQEFFKDIKDKDSIVVKKTNKILLETVDISDITTGKSSFLSISFAYADLIKGLKKEDGSDLPAKDTGLSIGDYWELSYESTTSEGNLHKNYKATKVALGTRYAGIYTVVESAYWNSGSNRGGWNGGEVTIESVNATVYRHKGLAFWDDNVYYFTVDPATNVITVLDKDLEGSGATLNGSAIMTCTGGTGAFESIPCDETTSLATPDDVKGKDQLEFTVGYFRGVGATREFYEKLIKKVD